jgi:hypothetical protein
VFPSFSPSGRISDGCHVTLRSEASEPAEYEVRKGGEVWRGTLQPGERSRPQLCWLSPTDLPSVTVASPGRGSVEFRLDPYCSEHTIVFQDFSVRDEGPGACS